MPAVTINCITQDRKGFLWIGSLDGISRYNGYEFQTFRHDPGDPVSISDNKVNYILEDKNGTLWVGAQSGLNSFDPKTEQFTRFPRGATVNHIYQDKAGMVWVGTDKGLKCIDPADKGVPTAKQLKDAPFDVGEIQVFRILEDRSGLLWVGTGEGIFLWNEVTRKVARFRNDPLDGSSLSHDAVFAVTEDHAGSIWVGTLSGFNRFEAKTRSFERIPLDSLGHPGWDIDIFEILEDRQNKLWLGGNGGLIIYDPKTNASKHFYNDPKDPRSLNANPASPLFQDRTGLIWVGSGVFGLSKYNPGTQQVIHYPTKPLETFNAIFEAYRVAEFNPGELLIPRKEGLAILDWRKGVYKPFPYLPKSGTDSWNTGITCFHQTSGGQLWLGTARGGFFVFDPEKATFTHYQSDENNPNSLTGNTIRDIHEDKFGNIWIAAWYPGVSRYNAGKNNFTRFVHNPADPASLSNDHARTIYLDNSGGLWIGTRGGLNQFHYDTETFTSFVHDPENPQSISDDTAFSIYEDENGIFWIGTYGGGLNRFDRKTGRFNAYTVNDGLTNNSVFGVSGDKKGNLWLLTFDGICQFNISTETFTALNRWDGVWDKKFHAFSNYISPFSGEHFYEGEEGLYIFHPDSLRADTTPPQIAFTGFSVLNRPAPIARTEADLESRDTFFLPRSISETTQIILPYNKKVITFEFAALHFAAPKANQYAYMLEGFDENWQPIGNKRSATFTNLNPGTYTFRVKASNADGVWNEKGISVQLIVTPPWWRTWWAKLLYAAVIVLVFLGILKYQKQRVKLRTELEYEKKEADRLKELDTLKSRLYANITHEFRTPLTVISGMAEKIKSNSGEWMERGLAMIRRNSRQLLELVNQMLDLSKLESGAMSVNWVRGNVVSYLNYISESFKSLAESKGITLHFHSEAETILTDYDPEKLLAIFSNLLSNAIKFTPEDGNIDVEISHAEIHGKPGFQTKIKDTGIGIPPEVLPKIFERFYQVDNSFTRQEGGTGIGLTFCREMVIFLKGELTVNSTPGMGSVFTVTLPLAENPGVKAGPEIPDREADPADNFSGVVAPSPTGWEHSAAEGLSEILIVEDNADVVGYMQACLKGEYRVVVAANGREGVQKAIERVPDIIISDVMMPEMDGFQLCQTLKTDFRTSHIPVILLTAKATVEDRIAGLERGADVYLDKPFNEVELKVRIRKLIELRQQLQDRYSALGRLTPSEDKAVRLEDQFVLNARMIVEREMDNSEFSTPDFCRAIGVSRTQLHNKLKALTGRSATGFIRVIRLKRAKELLSTTNKNVSEVAYEVGFSDPNYFTRCFIEEFGIKPSDLKKDSPS